MFIRESHLEVTRKNDGSVVADLTVLDDVPDESPAELRDRIANLDNEELHDFHHGNQRTAEGRVVWAASGVIPVITVDDGTYVALGLRDKKAPSYPYHFASASGMSDSREELLNPERICIREGLEEILFASTDTGQPQEWITPKIRGVDWLTEDDYIRPPHKLWEETSKGIDHLMVGPDPAFPTAPDSTVDAPTSLHPVGSDTLNITFDNEQTTRHGHLVIDPAAGAVDIMMVMHIDLTGHSLSNLRLLDGECFKDTLVNRDIYLFPVAEFQNMVDGAETVTAHRRYKSGKVWNGYRWTTNYNHGVEPTLNHPRIVPNARTIGDHVNDVLDRN